MMNSQESACDVDELSLLRDTNQLRKASFSYIISGFEVFPQIPTCI